ncbi:methyltransferase [Actibacterium sp. MT2.3-13A]|uniref:tRNA1(Val) (adenine(37)-N6)-methyltransferase n=1 Tax=Actibacterium sp. MT2.3-13A TaxID=2828332 RepID=UPI001BA66782
MDDLTRDFFLGGDLALWQPRQGFRAGVDAVFLAAAVPARPGDSVLELGCGVGTASLCLGKRVEGLSLTGVEIQPAYAALARRNAAENGVALEVVEGDLAQLPPQVKQRHFTHVIANPPYFRRDRSLAAQDTGRETALGEATPLSRWIDTAARRLAHRGRLTMIQRAERVPEMLSALDGRLGSVELLPLAPRAGRRAKLVLLRAVKGGRAPFALLPPVVLHEGAEHGSDAEDYRPDIAAVLRGGAGFPWPGA